MSGIVMSDFEFTRERYERLLQIPSDKRSDDNIFEIMRLTENLKIFQSFKMTEIHREICRHIFSRSVEKGEIIFKQGDEGDAYYLVLRGCVDLYTYDIDPVDGKTKLNYITSLLPGSGFGELALLYNCPRTATAIPNTHTDLIVFKKRIYTKYVKDLHEKALLELVKFYYSISIFKKEPINNIIKYCLRTQRRTLNAYESFLRIGDYLNDYCFVLSGSIKCYAKIKINKGIMKNAHRMTEDEFTDQLASLQTKTQANVEISDDPNEVYEEVLSIMEFKEKDMFAEYYAAKSKKIDVYFMSSLPVEIVCIKCDDFKKINPQLNDAILKYSSVIFDYNRVFKKFHKNLTWKATKTNLLYDVLKKK